MKIITKKILKIKITGSYEIFCEKNCLSIKRFQFASSGGPWHGIAHHVVVSVFVAFPINSKHDAPFHCIAYEYSCSDWDGLWDHLRDVPWEGILKLCFYWC